MKTIAVRVSGDSWLNQLQVKEQLKNTQPGEWVCFDTGAEGISLKHSGILAFIDSWVLESGHDPACIVVNNPNSYEKTNYKNVYPAIGNHFFSMSERYQTLVPDINSGSTKFGFFVGRHTQERNQIARDIILNYQQDFLISVMKSRYTINPWDPVVQQIKSIDDVYVSDQYSGKVDTNLSLLCYYEQFQIELVAETMCFGDTFFPTEKTIRPILAGRPFLIFGPVNFIYNLKKLGFETYDQCWSEEYDQFEGQTRWTKIKQIVSDIIDNNYNVELAQQIAHRNREHLKKWHRGGPLNNMPLIANDN